MIVSPPFSIGSGIAKTAGTIYQADKDGIVCCYLDQGANSTGECYGLIGPSSPPVNTFFDIAPVGLSNAVFGTGVMIVRKGEYYQVVKISTGNVLYYKFYPLG